MKSSWVKSVIVLVIGVIIVGCTGTQGGHWRVFSSTDLYEGSYYVESMTRSRNKVISNPRDLVRVSIKLQYREKGIAEYVKKFGKDYGNLSYSLELWEIDCISRKHRMLSFYQYSIRGDVLNTNQAKNQFSESVGNSLSEAVCK